MKAKSIIAAVEGVTSKWAKQRKREEREASARQNRYYRMTRYSIVTVRDAAWRVMEKAYLKASANGTLPAHARQIMYAARGDIQQLADRNLGSRFDQYFTQQLLPDYIEEKGVAWNVVYDARGHFAEPHDEHRQGEIALGTLQVRNYLARIDQHTIGDGLDIELGSKTFPTCGPRNRFGAVLFIEKEGFMPLFEEVQLAKRYDLAIMSTKGMSVTASRLLVDRLCGRHGIPLLVLHDFDKAGFSILGTLRRSTRRYSFRGNFEVIDLGLRLDDIDGLEAEEVSYRELEEAMEANLEQNGATADEIDFLRSQRVELNAMASDEFVEFIEGKLDEHGIKKVVPDDGVLEQACRRARLRHEFNKRLEKIREDARKAVDAMPLIGDLHDKIVSSLAEEPELAWDEALAEIVKEEERDT